MNLAVSGFACARYSLTRRYPVFRCLWDDQALDVLLPIDHSWEVVPRALGNQECSKRGAYKLSIKRVSLRNLFRIAIFIIVSTLEALTACYIRPHVFRSLYCPAICPFSFPPIQLDLQALAVRVRSQVLDILLLISGLLARAVSKRIPVLIWLMQDEPYIPKVTSMTNMSGSIDSNWSCKYQYSASQR